MITPCSLQKQSLSMALLLHLAGPLFLGVISSYPAMAGPGSATPLAALSLSPETTVVLGGVTVTDEDVVIDDLVGGTGLLALGLVPGQSAIVAYHQTLDGEHLIVLETTVALGAITATPQDIVRIDASLVASLEFDGSAAGLPQGVGIDALTMDGSDYLLSFDTTVTLDGTTFDDEDLARTDGTTFSLELDLSADGVDPALDLDAAHRLENGSLLLSFDGAGNVGGIDAHDEDVLELSTGGVWTLAFDGSADHGEWSDSDIDALFADVFVLEVARSGSGSGSIASPSGIDCGVDCSEILAPGTVVTLTATADPGSTFTGWTGAVCGQSMTCELTIDGDTSVVGTFDLSSDVIFIDGFETGSTSEWN